MQKYVTKCISAEQQIPLNTLFRFHQSIKNSLSLQCFLLQISINLSKYIYIFWLKDPASFHDDFWNYFLNIWIAGLSYGSQFIFVYLPGKQNTNFYIFSGKNPANDSSKLSKFNFPFAIIAIVSIMVHIFVNIKILFYKKNDNNQVNEQNYQQNYKQPKNMLLKTLEKQSLPNFTIISCFLIGFSSLIFLLSKVSQLEPHKLNEYPNYLMIYWINLANSLLLTALLSILIYCRNATMRQMMAREIKEFLRISLAVDLVA